MLQRTGRLPAFESETLRADLREVQAIVQDVQCTKGYRTPTNFAGGRRVGDGPFAATS